MVDMKVGIYVDEETWKEIKNLTFKKYGTLRGLSREVNESLKANLPLLTLRKGAGLLGIEIRRISGEEVVKKRPKMPTGSLWIVKEMRARI